jgi:hypothetical protein
MKKKAPYNEVIESYVLCIIVSLKALKCHGKYDSNLAFPIDRLLRRWTHYHHFYQRDFLISESAREKAIEMGIDPEIMKTCSWGEQLKKLKDKGRKIFHHEHLADIKGMILSLMEIPEEELTPTKIHQTLDELVAVAWTTKEEKYLKDNTLKMQNSPDKDVLFQHGYCIPGWNC